MTIFSGQSVISRVYTSRFGNGTGSHGTSTEVVLKKYQVPGTVPSGKPPKSEPYRTVPCRTMQWKSAFSLRSKPDVSCDHNTRGLDTAILEYKFTQIRLKIAQTTEVGHLLKSQKGRLHSPCKGLTETTI